MIMRSDDSRHLTVTLEGAELSDYGLTFEQLDYAKSRTKKLLNALLAEASRTTEFRLWPGRLKIEAFPTQDGGCLICFSITPRKIWRRRENVTKIYRFPALQDLLDGIRAAYINHVSSLKSQLFKLGDEWLLQVLGGDRKADAILHEYAEIYRGKSPDEYGQLICADAINTIGKAFCPEI